MSIEDTFVEDRIFTEIRPGYEVLHRTFIDALNQAMWGKGFERHSMGGLQGFEDQPAMEVTRRVGLGFPLGQAMKKIIESQRKGLTPIKARAEMYGALVYLATAIMYLEETEGADLNAK